MCKVVFINRYVRLTTKSKRGHARFISKNWTSHMYQRHCMYTMYTPHVERRAASGKTSDQAISVANGGELLSGRKMRGAERGRG